MIEELSRNYQENGSCYIKQASVPISKKDLKTLENLCNEVKKEFITIGDADEPNHLWVGRFMSDKDRPRLLNKELAKVVIEIVGGEKIKKLLKNIMKDDRELYLRRVQFNKIDKDCFIGHHLDVDSNPDYLCACVIQFGDDYDGGIFRVYTNKKDFIDYKTEYNSLMISNCHYPHEVTKVLDGSRKSLVFFFAHHKKMNRRSR